MLCNTGWAVLDGPAQTDVVGGQHGHGTWGVNCWHSLTLLSQSSSGNCTPAACTCANVNHQTCRPTCCQNYGCGDAHLLPCVQCGPAQQHVSCMIMVTALGNVGVAMLTDMWDQAACISWSQTQAHAELLACVKAGRNMHRPHHDKVARLLQAVLCRTLCLVFVSTLDL